MRQHIQVIPGKYYEVHGKSEVKDDPNYPELPASDYYECHIIGKATGETTNGQRGSELIQFEIIDAIKVTSPAWDPRDPKFGIGIVYLANYQVKGEIDPNIYPEMFI